MGKLCPTCKEVGMEPPPDRMRRWVPTGTLLHRAAGCPDCAMTGYRGRFSILEVLTVSPEVERRIAAGETAEHIATAARRSGMKSLWDSGLADVLRGESTLDELTRVVEIPQDDDSPPESPSAPRKSGAVRAPSRLSPHGETALIPEPVAAPETLTANFELLEEPAPPRRSGPHGQPAIKVLLVDDEDSLRKVMRDLLERDGYDVAGARDGVHALDEVDRVGPDIIVLDLNLHALGGCGVPPRGSRCWCCGAGPADGLRGRGKRYTDTSIPVKRRSRLCCARCARKRVWCRRASTICRASRRSIDTAPTKSP